MNLFELVLKLFVHLIVLFYVFVSIVYLFEYVGDKAWEPISAGTFCGQPQKRASAQGHTIVTKKA